MHLRRLSVNQAAFTIIELLVVLAIAAVILITVLIAVPQLQRARRDTQRKNYVAHLIVSLHDYYANNQTFPNPDIAAGTAQVNNFKANYAPAEQDPSTGQPYNITYLGSNGSHSTIPAIGQVIITKAHWCNIYGDGDPGNPGDPIAGDDKSVSLDFSVVVGIEAGQFYCQDNHSR